MIEIRRIEGRNQLSKFVQFAIDLYKGNNCYVPPIISMEVDTFDASKNPAFEFCDAIYYMAYREGKPVGRIAGFINRRANEKFNEKVCRFCWVDFIDDLEVSRTLLDTIKAWGKSHGMTKLVGPIGPTDIDYEGCMTEGFDQLVTTATIYNYPYYPKHFEAYGMQIEATWWEFRMEVPDQVPEKHLRIAEIVKKKYNLRVIKDTDSKHIVKHWGKKLFDLMNVAYAPLYGFTELTDKQIDYYINLYLPQVPLQFIRIIADADDNVIGFGISYPSLSRAQQKANGHLFPFGWIHMLRALYWKGANDTADLLLIGIRPDFQGKGVNALLFTELIPEFRAWGFKHVETNCELTTNSKVQSQWSYFDPVHHKTRSTFSVEI